MLYVDTSALVALIVPEPGSAAVARWYAGATGELASAVWCITEFASALGIKQRTGQLNATQAQQAWQRFEQLTAHDLTLLPVTPRHFHRAPRGRSNKPGGTYKHTSTRHSHIHPRPTASV